MEVRRGHSVAGRKRVLSVFQTMFIQMPCFRCRLVNISKGLHPPSLCHRLLQLWERVPTLSQKRLRWEHVLFVCLVRGQGHRSLDSRPPISHKWERKCFSFLGKSCQKTPRSELCTGLPLPAQKSCQPLFFLLACGEGSRPVLDSVPLRTVPTGSL